MCIKRNILRQVCYTHYNGSGEAKLGQHITVNMTMLVSKQAANLAQKFVIKRNRKRNEVKPT